MIRLPSGRKVSKGVMRNASNMVVALTGSKSLSKDAAKTYGIPWPAPRHWHLVVAGYVDLSEIIPKTRCEPRKDFYASWEWKAARYEALRVHGHRCQCCGWAPGDTHGGRLVVDHIKPRSKFPELELDQANLQVLCNDCNMGKSNVHTDDFRATDDWLARIGRDG